MKPTKEQRILERISKYIEERQATDFYTGNDFDKGFAVGEEESLGEILSIIEEEGFIRVEQQ